MPKLVSQRGELDIRRMVVIDMHPVQYRGDAKKAGGHIFVRESAPQVRTHHVHVVDLDGPQWKAYLEFRDFLRTDRTARQIYSSQKELLAERYLRDRKRYTAAKEEVVRKLLEQTEEASR